MFVSKVDPLTLALQICKFMTIWREEVARPALNVVLFLCEYSLRICLQ